MRKRWRPCAFGELPRAQCEWPVSAQSLRCMGATLEKCLPKPVVDDRKLGVISYFRRGIVAYLCLVVKGQ